jgi:hypothetical protein
VVVVDAGVASVQPLRPCALSTAVVDNPDRGPFRWDGIDARTNVELRTPLGELRPRVPGSWTLEPATPEASQVRLRATVDADGSATPTGVGSGAEPAMRTGQRQPGG